MRQPDIPQKNIEKGQKKRRSITRCSSWKEDGSTGNERDIKLKPQDAHNTSRCTALTFDLHLHARPVQRTFKSVLHTRETRELPEITLSTSPNHTAATNLELLCTRPTRAFPSLLVPS